MLQLTIKKPGALIIGDSGVLDIQLSLRQKQLSFAQHVFQFSQLQLIFPQCHIVGVDLLEGGLGRHEAGLQLDHLPGRGRGLLAVTGVLRDLDPLLDDLGLHVAEDALHLLASLHLVDKLPLERGHLGVEVNKLNQA